MKVAERGMSNSDNLHQTRKTSLTENAAASQCSLQRLIWLVLLIAANNTVLHVVIFQHKAEQFQSVSMSPAAIAELRVTATACHVITAFRSLDVNLNDKPFRHNHTVSLASNHN